MSDPFPQHVISTTTYWAGWLAETWKGEVPLRLHGTRLAVDGTLDWSPDFARYMGGDDEHKRTTKVMRKLRRQALRVYEVAYRQLVLGEPIEQTTVWLNERARRNHIPYPTHRPGGPHYTHKDTQAILIAAIQFAREHW